MEVRELYADPGLRHVGYASHEKANNGQLLPMFEPVTSEGKIDINTVDGWTALADAVNRKSFIYTFGREPADHNELYTWVEQMCREAEVSARKAPSLTYPERNGNCA